MPSYPCRKQQPLVLRLVHAGRRCCVAGISVVLIAGALTSRVYVQSALQITAPANGTLVHPGQTITVTVAPAAGVCFPSGIAIMGEVPLGDAWQLTAPSFA